MGIFYGVMLGCNTKYQIHEHNKHNLSCASPLVDQQSTIHKFVVFQNMEFVLLN